MKKQSILMAAIVLLFLSVLCASGAPTSGYIVAWGYNGYGQCDVPTGDDFVAIAAGMNHSLALSSDGSLAGWGSNYMGSTYYGQAEVPQGTFADIATGFYFNVVIKSDGTLSAWGRNAFGQTDVPAGTFIDVAAGGEHAIALRTDGSLAAWGLNQVGQTDVPAGNDYIAVASGDHHSAALKSDGSILAWGWNYHGQLDVPGGEFVDISSGYYHGLALSSDGSLAGWGHDEYLKSTVPAGNDFIDIAAGFHHSLALKSNGSLIAWGANNDGQCNVPLGNNFSMVAAGGDFSLALASEPAVIPAPSANAGEDQTVQCACQTSEGTKATLNGAGSYDPDGNPLTYTWTGPFLGSPLNGPYPMPTVTLLPGCLGMYPISLVVNNGQLDSEPDTVTVAVQDTTPPIISLNGPASIILECRVDSYTEFGATVSDNCDSAVPLQIGGDTVDASICGTYIVTYNAIDDSDNAATEVTRTVIVQDTTSPVITIVAPESYGLYPVGGLELDFSAYDLVNGNIEPPALSGTLTDAVGYDETVYPGDVPGAGIYTLMISAVDGAGNEAHETVFFVVYDAEGGFVTGGGWIDSPEGAYLYEPSLTGKANFGFVSKYKKGATVPTGNTEFVFKAGDLNFHSTSYDWLVVTGSDYARFKGAGTINGSGDYRFMLWAGDAPDTFRIKIWTEDESGAETVVYDNGFDQTIMGGNIVIHTSKK